MLRMPNALGQLAVLIALGFPSSAAAATLGELPFQRAPDGAACLAPTGAPGELSRWAEGGAEVLAARQGGLGRPELVAFGKLPGCPRGAADVSGAAVVAGATESAMRVALREPGGGSFGMPVTLGAAKNVFELSVAVSPHGDAVVAWAEWSSRAGTGPSGAARRRRRLWRTDGARAMASSHRWGGAGRDGGGRRERRARPRADRHRGESGEHGHRTLRRAGSAVGACHVSAAGGLRPCARRRAGRTRRAGSDDVGRFGQRARAPKRRRPGRAAAAHRLAGGGQTPSQMAVAFGADGRTVVAWHDR